MRLRILRLPLQLQWLFTSITAGLLTRATHPKTLILTGLIFGLGQWLVLYPVLHPRARLAHVLWLPATAFSGLVGYLLIATLGQRLLGPVLIAATAPYQNFASHLIFLTVLWSVIGLGQWPLLREVLPYAGWWILISAVGGAMGALIDLAILAAGKDAYSSLCAGMLAGGGYGAVTGKAIARLKDAK